MKLKKAIEDTVKTSGGTLTIGNIPLTKQAEKVLKITQIESKIYKADVIGTEHLLLSLLRDEVACTAQGSMISFILPVCGLKATTTKDSNIDNVAKIIL